MMLVGSRINGKQLLNEDRKIEEIRSPYDGSLVGKAVQSTIEDVEYAIDIANQVYHSTMKRMPAYRKAEILTRTASLLEQRAGDFIEMLALEAGKPIKDGKAEVSRAEQLLRFAAEEAKTMEGELLNMGAATGGENRCGMVMRVPLGVVAAISPFNFPLNLVLHKLAPAIAVGNTVVLKPAEKTPISAIMLSELFEEAGLPAGALNVVLGKGSVIGDRLVTDSRVKKVTFTGSLPVGEHIYKTAGMKKVTLELGSNSPNLIFEDADLSLAARLLVRGAFAYSGQICISAQIIYVQKSVYDEFLRVYVPLVEKLRLGNPLEESTDVGPMISETEAIRAEKSVQRAVSQGARILTGGGRNKSLYEPTVLVNVTKDMTVVCEEMFAPVVSVIPFDSEEEVIKMANHSDFGIQAGVFTSNINRAFRLAHELETGGVWINEMSTYRQDNYPYGGVKKSGLGREGVKYAIEEMTERKFIGLRFQ